MQIKIRRPDGKEVGRGQARLWDMSETGFRVDRLRWKNFLAPTTGAVFAFETSKGRWNGARGQARVAWHLDNRKGRGAMLGARVVQFQDRQSRNAWQEKVANLLN